MDKQNNNIAAFLPAPNADLVIREREIPVPGPLEILIRNHAVGLNPIDWKRQTWGFMIPSYPTILGTDLSGVVVAVGSSVSTFKPGDRVIGFAHGLRSQNLDNCAFQTYTVVRANAAVVMPPSMTFTQAATVPTAVGTAAMCIVDVFGLSLPGWASDTAVQCPENAAILVWGGASTGVGNMVVQFAQLAGLTVFATASPHHHARLLSLGAAGVVDYHSPTAVDEVVMAAKRAGKDIVYAVDAISKEETLAAVVEILSRASGNRGKAMLAHTTPWPASVVRPGHMHVEQVRGDDLWERREDLCTWLYGTALPTWLADGQLVLSPSRTVAKNISGIQDGLNELKRGVSGEKLVVEI
ncbi:chaperonin 10-like protein [Podospora aff. communis PSN243]|uniref:Chaperonin 10-like protein n=1 Tax=Podospora aff. communis PSN243 TaxID=3040156 RepID=A0AAV9GD14_9PEZI|nr:chaperonin 10-like protein [Podospora aff. communis PSN243]